jgi:hypothetical protein
MGCHTWFYKKIETPSEDEIRSTVKDKCEIEIQFLEKTLTYIDNPENECSIHDREWTTKTLNEFWEKYPDGMICFG